MHKKTGIRRLYKGMVTENRDLSFELERNHALEVVLAAKVKRSQLERDSTSETNGISKRAKKESSPPRTSRSKKAKQAKTPQAPPPKMVSAINAYSPTEDDRQRRRSPSK